MSHDDTVRLPLAGKLPTNDILVEIFDRVGCLSDELNDPDGLLSRRLAGAADVATTRHVQMMAAMKRVLDEILLVKGDVDKIKARVGIAEDKIRILDHANVPAQQVQ